MKMTFISRWVYHQIRLPWTKWDIFVNCLCTILLYEVW